MSIQRDAEALNMSPSEYLTRLALLYDKSSSGNRNVAVVRLIIALGISGHDHDEIIHELHELKNPESEVLQPMTSGTEKILQERLKTLKL